MSDDQEAYLTPIAENKAFTENNTDLASILRSIQATGREGFFGKESGDANKGFFFINPPKNYFVPQFSL